MGTLTANLFNIEEFCLFKENCELKREKENEAELEKQKVIQNEIEMLNKMNDTLNERERSF